MAAALSISVHQLNHYFGSGQLRKQALFDINLEIAAGEIVIMTGPSGSGKTTLLSILAGILTPTSGEINLLGEEITRMSAKKLSRFRRDSIGFIFQGFNLFGALNAVENVQVALEIKGIKGKSATNQALELLDMVGLANKANLLPRDLSGGQKQRIAIARALAGNPQLIMADEPTAALDSHNGQAVIELLCNLAREGGSTVVMVTHDSRIQSFADNVAFLEDGEITENYL